MRFLMFFLGEFANVWILCALPVAMYFGGWQIPWGGEMVATDAGAVWKNADWVIGAAPYFYRNGDWCGDSAGAIGFGL